MLTVARANTITPTTQFTYQGSNHDFVHAFLLYHMAPGNWSLDNFSSANTIIPTFLNLSSYSSLENGNTQVTAWVTSGTYPSIRQFPSQDTASHIIQTLKYDNTLFHVVDQVLQIPPPYPWAVANIPELGPFRTLLIEAGVGSVDLAGYAGFTAFIPTSNFSQEALERYPAASDLLQLYHNHVRLTLITGLKSLTLQSGHIWEDDLLAGYIEWELRFCFRVYVFILADEQRYIWRLA